jgi:hypothetical protein
VRELLEQNGDVPFLAGMALAPTAAASKTSRNWTSAHLTKTPMKSTSPPFADGRLAIGEARCVASLGTSREASQAIGKLLRVSYLLGADEILLAATAPGPRMKRETDQLLKATAGHR